MYDINLDGYAKSWNHGDPVAVSAWVYAYMVDVVARAGQLVAAAYQFSFQMTVEPPASRLGALLSGCMKHRRLDLAEMTGRKLIEFDVRYIGLSNVYACHWQTLSRENPWSVEGEEDSCV
ncbi:hypothetical protein D5086_010346 [Populus alba]|uniref:Uncharacterized protein n=2 Tax=Populus TaxID=3689 RepID=A0ACC4CAK1_POPAL|nr:hypothetical protein NC653_013392 [Populus alba x Populus x berolinensis]